MQKIRRFIQALATDRYLSVSLAITVVIFTIDVLSPRPHVFLLLYFIPVILSQRSRTRHRSSAVPLLISLLIVTAFIVQRTAYAMPVPLENPALAVCSTWVGYFLLQRIIRMEVLLQREHDYITLVDHAPYAIMRFDTNCRLLYANRAAGDIGGATTVLSGRDWDRITAGVRTALVSGGIRSYSADIDCARPGGTAHYQICAIPETGDRGSIISVVAVFQDITALKRTQEELERLKEYYKTLSDHSPDFIARLDWDLRFTYVNASVSAILEKDADFFIGKTIGDAIVPDNGAYLTAMAQSVFKTGLTHNTEISVTLRGGKKHLGISIVPEKDPRGGIQSLLAIVHDITDIKKAEQVLCRDRETLQQIVDDRSRELFSAQRELERTRRMSDIGRLASTIAHELRNPLSAIKTAVYNIQRKSAGLALEKHVGTINRKIMESDQIIQNLLSFSRIRAASREPVRIGELLNDAIATVALRYPGRAGAIERRIDIPPGETVDADLTKMKILFSNILDNAFQALPDDGGRIEVAARMDAARGCVVTIADNGGGIAKENLARIFEPFYTTKSKGTGLGLAICREIAELHGGTIQVESGEEKGTLFKIILPGQHTAAALAAAQEDGNYALMQQRPPGP